MFTMPVCQIDPNAAENCHAEQRLVRSVIVVAAHADNRQSGERTSQIMCIVRVVAQMQYRIGLFLFDRIGHSHTVTV